MGVVAVITGHQTFCHRMMTATIELSPLLKVTGQTDCLVLQFIEHRCLAGMEGVAGYTGQIRRLMLTGGPVHSVPRLVTVQAHLILHLDVAGRKPFAAFKYYRRLLHGADMIRACTMAAFTSLVGKWGPCYAAATVTGIQDRSDCGIVMAGQAGLRAL